MQNNVDVLPVRLFAYMLLGLASVGASAAVTCEQLAEVAFATQKLRDQGYSLTTVLAETDKLEASNKFTAGDLVIIRSIVDKAFKDGGRMPHELLQSCKDQRRR